MSLVNEDGVGISQEIDRDAMRVREEVRDLDIQSLRAFVIGVMRAVDVPWLRIAQVMRASRSVVMSDVKHPTPDLDVLLRHRRSHEESPCE